MAEAPLPPGLSRETKIRRDASGRWWNGDDPVTHPNLVRSFDQWIDVAEDGRYCLKNDINWAYVTIEGPPVFVRAAIVEGDAVRLVTSGDLEEPLDPATLRQARDGSLWCDVRGGRLAARFDNHAAAQLADLIGEDEAGVLIRLGGRTFRPPTVDDPLSPARSPS